MLNDDLKITGNAGNREEANEVENSSEAAQVKSFRKTCQILGIRIFTIFLKQTVKIVFAMSLFVWLLVVQYENSYDFVASFSNNPFFDGELQHFTTKMQIVL